MESSNADTREDYNRVQYEPGVNVSLYSYRKFRAQAVPRCTNQLSFSAAAAGIKRSTEVEGLYTKEYLSKAPPYQLDYDSVSDFDPSYTVTLELD